MTMQYGMVRRTGVLGLLAALAILPARLMAQESSTTPLPATLLRRLGSAVEGYRTGNSVWVVASSQFPHDVQGVYSNPVEASNAAHAAGPMFHSYGPYYSPPDTLPSGGTSIAYGLLCIKQWDTSCIRTRDTTRSITAVDNVQHVIISVVTNTGTIVDTLRPQQVEAVFFTMSAIDKLLIPYYTHVYGSRYAASFREDYIKSLTLQGQQR